MNIFNHKMLFTRKLKAAGWHFSISLSIFIMLFLWVRFLLYPSFYFGMSGGLQGLMLILAVDVVLGPLMTLIIFNPKKKIKELIMDFLIVATVQLAALIYGVHTVYNERPTLTVLYQYGTATVLTHREVAADPALEQALTDSKVRLAGIPIVMYHIDTANTKDKYTSPLKTPKLVDKTTMLAQKSMKDPEDIAAFDTLKKHHKTAKVIAVVGKYMGAYIAVDHNFKFLGKIGEKPVGL